MTNSIAGNCPRAAGSRLLAMLVAAAVCSGASQLAAAPLFTADDPVTFSCWYKRSSNATLFDGELVRSSDDGAQPYSLVTTGAQINARNQAGVHQIAFGIATEAWSEPGSLSMLTGIEATTINREPANTQRKIAIWATFKNRADQDYHAIPSDAMNVNSQALRIESQPGTGFERGIVFAPSSLHESVRGERAAAIDLSEVPDDQIGSMDLIRIRPGVSLRYDPVSRTLYLYDASR